ncbi:MAG: Transcriptional regulator, TrmB [uncultured bacterium]|nr:MAG: Transcriptional regulator, TrmB [uncultured bacterium]
MQIKLFQLITNLGLDDKEARVYLAVLELGSETASKIAKKAEVDRVNSYNMLTSLKNRGLISEVEKSGVKYFSAESPEKLLSLGKETKEKIETNLTMLQSFLPNFLSLYKTGETRKPKVRFYEGKKGYLSVYKGILEDKPKEFLAIVNYAEFKKLVDVQYEEAWVKQRIKLGIKLRWLDFDSPSLRQERQEKNKKLRQIKFLPNKYKCSGGLFIYPHKLIFFSTSEEFMAVVIENEELAKFSRMVFELLWKFVGK